MDAFLIPLTAALLKFAPPKPAWVQAHEMGHDELSCLPDSLLPGEALA
jgi:hypothetical protein